MANRRLPSFETLAKELSSIAKHRIAISSLKDFAHERGLGKVDSQISVDDNYTIKGYSFRYDYKAFDKKGFGATFSMSSDSGPVMAQRIYYDGPYSQVKRGKIVREALEALLIMAKNPDAGEKTPDGLRISFNVL